MMDRKKKGAPPARTGLPADYPAFLESLKSRVRQAQTKAMLSVNPELIPNLPRPASEIGEPT